MTSCCIGYYSDISSHNSVIQGSFREILTDPNYVQDYSQKLLPISDLNKLYKENKPYVNPAFDLLMADENTMKFSTSTIRKGGKSNTTHYYDSMSGSGVRQGRSINNKLWKRLESEEKGLYENHELRDLKVGARSIKKRIKEKIKRKEPDIVKMGTKPQYPGEKLKKRLLNKSHDLDLKRAKIKEVLNKFR